MRKNKISFITILFIFISFMFSLFYILADFGKAISKQGGIVWLIISVFLFIAFIRSSKKTFLLSIIAVILLQIPIIINWIIWMEVTFIIFHRPFRIGFWGCVIHLAITSFSIYILVKMLRDGSKS